MEPCMVRGRDPVSRRPDPLLVPFLEAASEAEAQRCLDRLLRDHLDPILQGILWSRWRVSPHRLRGCCETPREREAQDVYSEAIVQMVEQLRAGRAGRARAPVSNFRAYAAVLVFRACHHILRDKYPQKAHLANRVRGVLTRQPEFALWRGSGGETLCGLAVWAAENRPCMPSARLLQLQQDPQTAAAALLPSDEHASPTVLDAFFQWLNHPIPLKDLVRFLAEFWNVREATMVQADAERETDAVCEGVPDTGADVARDVEQHLFLQWAWGEICRLRPPQRAALLLNLRDLRGRGIIALLPLLGVATRSEIARALGTPWEQFVRLWDRLPLDDAAVAALLHSTPLQVRGLRRAARLRLVRRLRGYEEPAREERTGPEKKNPGDRYVAESCDSSSGCRGAERRTKPCRH